MSDDDNKITIQLTDRRPVNISKEIWPVIASIKDWDNQYECQASRTWTIKVRKNKIDGRCIVYGWFLSQFASEAALYGGSMVDSIDDIVPTIHDVCNDLFSDHPSMARNLINELPSVEI